MSQSEEMRWSALMTKLTDCLVFARWNTILGGTDPKMVPGVGLVVKHEPSTRLWLTILRNTNSNLLGIIGDVMEVNKTEFHMPLQYIREYGFQQMFNLSSLSSGSTYGKPTGRELAWDGPLTKWGDLAEVKKLIDSLGDQLATRIKDLASVTDHANFVNFYGCEAEWASWFFKCYVMQGVRFTRKLGAVLIASGAQCTAVIQTISRSEYADMFFDDVLTTPPSNPIRPTTSFPYSSASLHPDPIAEVHAFFNEQAFCIRANTELDTVSRILHKIEATPLMRLLKCPLGPNTIIPWLETRPELCHFVGIELIRSGTCNPYSPVTQRTNSSDPRNIMQYKSSAEELAGQAIEPIIKCYGLKTLANFLGAEKDQARNWRGLFQASGMEELKAFLANAGKGKAEMEMWDKETLIEQMATWVERVPVNQQFSYKQRVLEFLRRRDVHPEYVEAVNGFRANMLPWLDSDELLEWMNPRRISTSSDMMILDPLAEEVELTPLESLFKRAKVNAPAFVEKFQNDGFVIEDLPLVIDGFNDPDLETIRSLLTTPQKLALKRTLQAQGH